MEVRIYMLPEKEVHFPGTNYGCVVWNLEAKPKSVEIEGETYTKTEMVRSGDPYIDFIDIRENQGEVYENEESPIVGGLDIRFARDIASEIEKACQYLESL